MSIKTAAYAEIQNVPLEQAFLEGAPGSALRNMRVYARHLSSGTMRGEQQLGDENIQIRSSERQILIFDEDKNARILLGRDETGA